MIGCLVTDQGVRFGIPHREHSLSFIGGGVVICVRSLMTPCMVASGQLHPPTHTQAHVSHACKWDGSKNVSVVGSQRGGRFPVNVCKMSCMFSWEVKLGNYGNIP